MNLKQEGKIGHQIISSPRFNHLLHHHVHRNLLRREKERDWRQIEHVRVDENESWKEFWHVESEILRIIWK